MSQRAVSDLERGINATARKDTAALLADALGLDGHTRDLFVAAAALAAAHRAGDRPGQASALMLLSPMQLVTDDIPAAIASATGALQLYRDLGNRAGQAETLTQLGFLHMMTDDYPAAAAELRQALELFRGLGHRRGQGDALSSLGEVHCSTGDYRAAATCLRQALERCGTAAQRIGRSGWPVTSVTERRY